VTAVFKKQPSPEDGYLGLYITDLANRLRDEQQAVPNVAQWACAQLLDGIKADLQAFNISFDRWFSEQKDLFDSGAVADALKVLKDKGLLEEKDGALWFKSTAFGDDKDRVVRKQDGQYTYLASDIAYHRNKLDRGYDLL